MDYYDKKAQIDKEREMVLKKYGELYDAVIELKKHTRELTGYAKTDAQFISLYNYVNSSFCDPNSVGNKINRLTYALRYVEEPNQYTAKSLKADIYFTIEEPEIREKRREEKQKKYRHR